ncbi:hypothetical protein DPEC_G00296800, partial [Dallia pectoralis]
LPFKTLQPLTDPKFCGFTVNVVPTLISDRCQNLSTILVILIIWLSFVPVTCAQSSSVHPFPGILNFNVTQTNPESAFPGSEKCDESLFLYTIDDHQVCSSIQTVLSAVSPVFLCGGDVVTTQAILNPVMGTCLTNKGVVTGL